MSADEIRLRIEEASGLVAGIAVDRASDDAWFIEDLRLDSLSIIESLVLGHGRRGERRSVASPVARPVPPHGGESGRGVRLHPRPRDGHTLQRSSRDPGGQAGLHTISRLDDRAVREGQSHASPLDFANTVINTPPGQPAIWHGPLGVHKPMATGASSGSEAIGSPAEAVWTGLAACVPAGGVEVISPPVLRASGKAGLPCGRVHHRRPFDPGRSGPALSESPAVLVLEGRSVTKQHRNRASVQVVVWTHARRPVVVIPASYSFLTRGAEAHSESGRGGHGEERRSFTFSFRRPTQC
jgi:hypothetical protein